MSVLCGLSRSYVELLLARVGVGVGEAGGTPPANAIIADYFPTGRRPMAMAVFALGAPIGAWLGADLAGAVAKAWGWRAAFLALGAPGVLVGLLVFLTVREPRRGRLDANSDEVGARFPCVHALSRPSEGLPARDDGRRALGALGMGAA